MEMVKMRKTICSCRMRASTMLSQQLEVAASQDRLALLDARNLKSSLSGRQGSLQTGKSWFSDKGNPRMKERKKYGLKKARRGFTVQQEIIYLLSFKSLQNPKTYVLGVFSC